MSTLALLGGRKSVTAKSASPTWPRYSARAAAMVAMLVYTGRGLGQGRLVTEAGGKFAEYFGVQYALPVSSGTGSLHCALAGCEIEPGDEVITSPYSYGATASCILHHGAIPVFADVLPDTGLLDPARVEEKITSRTRGIMVVHLYGQPADMQGLQRVATKHHLKLMEDASQAHGARYHGQYIGTQSDAAGFSCMNTKLLAASELGIMVTNDRDTYDRAVLLSQHTGTMGRPPNEHGGGLRPEYHRYMDSLIYNYQATGIDSVLIMDQLPRLAGWNRNRAANRHLLVAALKDLDFVRFPQYPADVEPVYLMATFNYYEEQAQGVTRETFLQALMEEGVTIVNYVKEPISAWLRLQASAEGVPSAPWLANLRRAGVRYSTSDIPVCMELVEKRALEMTFGRFTEPEPKLMRQYADAFHKVAENLPALLEWQRRNAALVSSNK